MVNDRDTEADRILTQLTATIKVHCNHASIYILKESEIASATSNFNFEDRINETFAIIVIITETMLDTSLYKMMKSAMDRISLPFMIPVIHGVHKTAALDKLQSLWRDAKIDQNELEVHEDSVIQYTENSTFLEHMCNVVNGKCNKIPLDKCYEN